MSTPSNSFQLLTQGSLSPFDIPHVLEQVFLYIDNATLQSCLRVNKSWHAVAAPIRWRTCFIGWGKLCPPWDNLISNIQHIYDLTLALPLSRTGAGQGRQLDMITTSLRDCEKRLSPTNKSTSRLQALTVVVQETGASSHLQLLFPTIPQLRKLVVRTLRVTWATKPIVALETIIEHFPQLQELELLGETHLSIDGIDVNDRDTASRLCKESLASSLALNLTSLDFDETPLSAQRVIEIAPWFPRVRTLRICAAPLIESLHHCCSDTDSTYSRGNSKDEWTPSQVFARDFATAWPHLQKLSLNLDDSLRRIVSTMSFVSIQGGTVDLARITRDIIAALLPRLKLLNIPTILVDETVLDVISRTNNCITDITSGRTLGVHGEYEVPRLEQLSMSGPEWSSGHEKAGQALLRLLESCSTLKVLNARSFTIGSALLKHMKNNSSGSSNGNINSTDQKVTINSSLSATLFRPPHSGVWACTNLEYLHLNGSHGLSSNTALYKDDSNFELSHWIFRRISMLPKLRFLQMDGFTFSNELEISGFHQLATLRLLEAISVEFYWDKTIGSSEQGRAKSDDVIHGFLTRKDVEWMVHRWPRLMFLRLGKDEDILRERTIQRWIDKAAGPGRTVASKPSHYFTCLSESYRMK